MSLIGVSDLASFKKYLNECLDTISETDTRKNKHLVLKLVRTHRDNADLQYTVWFSVEDDELQIIPKLDGKVSYLNLRSIIQDAIISDKYSTKLVMGDQNYLEIVDKYDDRLTICVASNYLNIDTASIWLTDLNPRVYEKITIEVIVSD